MHNVSVVNNSSKQINNKEKEMSKNIHLMAIDCQNDFTSTNPQGSLYVQGGEKDMERLATFINRLSGKLDNITATLDSHRIVQIFHKAFWKNSNGEHPQPFTSISVEDVKNGTWTTVNPRWYQRALDYVVALDSKGAIPLMIWEDHCLIGSWGHSLYPSVSDALIKWETDNFGFVNYEIKGDSIWTESYGILESENSNPEEPSTMLNTRLVENLQEADELLICGEALNYCVRATVTQISKSFGSDGAKKFVLLEDCTSNVPNFESLGENFIKEMTAKGMRVTTSTDYLA